MTSKLYQDLRKELSRGNDDLNTKRRVDSAMETLREKNALDRLADQQPSLVNELRKRAIVRIEKNKDIQEAIKVEIERRSVFNRAWRKNENRANNRTVVLAILVLAFCVVLSALVASSLAVPLGGLTFESTISQVGFEQTSWYIASLSSYLLIAFVAFIGLRKRMKLWSKENETIPSNLRTGQFFMYAAILYILGMPSFLMFFSVFGIQPDGLQSARTGIVFFSLSIALIATYIFWERRIVIFQSNIDSKSINTMLKQESLSRIEHLQRIDRRVLEETNVIAKELEKEHNLHVDRWSTILPKYGPEDSWTNLGEFYDTYVDTEKQQELSDTIRYGLKGSFGIAGERGAGKTAMMKKLDQEYGSNDDAGVLTVWMSAPTSVNDRELPISILAKVASRAGARLSGNSSWPEIPPDQLPRVQSMVRTLRLLAMTSFCFAAYFGILMLERFIPALEQFFQVPNVLSQEAMASGSAEVMFTVLVAGCIVALSFGRWIKLNSGRFSSFQDSRFVFTTPNKPLAAASADVLEKLWYERKDSSSSNVSMSWGGSAIGSQAGIEQTREPFTVPHLIDMWQRYVEYLTSSRTEFRKVVIFIDEVDKLASRDRIEEFLRVLKALCDASNVFFFVSISKDAYDWFHKRHSLTTGRNVFDSSFSKVIWVKRLGCEELEALLQVRVIGPDLPTPFVQLIWMLSRGNPRDAQRLASELIREQEATALRDVAKELCVTHFRRLFRSYYVEASHKGFYSSPFSRLVLSGIEAHEVERVIRQAADDLESWIKSNNKDSSAQALYSMMLVEMQYALSVCDIFFNYNNSKIFQNLGKSRPYELVRNVHKRISEGVPQEAEAWLKDMRAEVGLPILQCFMRTLT